MTGDKKRQRLSAEEAAWLIQHWKEQALAAEAFARACRRAAQKMRAERRR